MIRGIWIIWFDYWIIHVIWLCVFDISCRYDRNGDSVLDFAEFTALVLEINADMDESEVFWPRGFDSRWYDKVEIVCLQKATHWNSVLSLRMLHHVYHDVCRSEVCRDSSFHCYADWRHVPRRSGLHRPGGLYIQGTFQSGTKAHW